ncbi:hypothetical protein BZL29_5732 [Mycobacterium kansasii]|uniref:Uncharacterized protein n=1 Tax=Mycobacterium kansasii TaxID=1768 RepID=A0A1V3WWD6_MYCKA|nr:hypothetical protein BZL29_5732 [Mycobacterium kansasii]
MRHRDRNAGLRHHQLGIDDADRGTQMLDPADFSSDGVGGGATAQGSARSAGPPAASPDTARYWPTPSRSGRRAGGRWRRVRRRGRALGAPGRAGERREVLAGAVEIDLLQILL